MASATDAGGGPGFFGAIIDDARRLWTGSGAAAREHSARDPADVATVRHRIIEIFEAAYEEIELTVPYDRQAVLSEMHDTGRVVEEKWEESGVAVRWRAEPEAIGRVRSRLR